MTRKKTSKKSSALPIILLAAGMVLIIVAAVFLFEANNQGNSVSGVVGRVNPTEAKNAFDQGEAVILDVRSKASYANSHAAGAINIPLEDLNNRIDELDPNQWIITYCT